MGTTQVRSDADAHAPRCLAVLRPLRVVLVNLPEGHFTEVAARVRRHHESIVLACCNMKQNSIRPFQEATAAHKCERTCTVVR